MTAVPSWLNPNTIKIKIVTNAAGNANLELKRNLSFIWQPKLWVAAMVVSEIKDRLSPNIAPESKQAPINPKGESLFSASAITIGPSVTIDPTEVPDAKERNAAMTKTPTGK